MTQPARQEPSMEEILASIRRIITEDEPAKPSPSTEAAGPEPLRAAPPPAMPATPLPSRFAPAPATDSSALRDEELVSELLRPMLKAWLDDNLPAIVERLVRAEIERVSRARD